MSILIQLTNLLLTNFEIEKDSCCNFILTPYNLYNTIEKVSN